VSLASLPTDETLEFELSGGRGKTQRLWQPMSYRPHRRRLPEGADKFGTWLLGVVQRRLLSRRKLRVVADEVVELADSMRNLSDRNFDRRIETAREAIVRGKHTTEALVNAFAVVREATRREIGLALYPVQVMGGWAMTKNCCVEMATGEGKTITACLTAAVMGWNRRGVHVVTVNDYLARRDAEITGPIYKRLGMSVGSLQDGTPPPERKEIYAGDVVYGADKQFIFDYLRDRLVSPLQPRVSGLLLEELAHTEGGDGAQLWTNRVVQRGLYAAIIDEADSVLIDEGTTPAIIGVDMHEKNTSGEHYSMAAEVARELAPGKDFLVDWQRRRVDLLDPGQEKLEALAGKLPAFWAGPRRREELVTQALTALHLYTRDDHYIVRNDDVHIVDVQTGRVLEGRQWQHGLHQAVQAKEGLEVTTGRQTMARIGYARFFQLYQHLAGMTGTAWEVRNELWASYQMKVVRVPTNRPLIRTQAPDRVAKTIDEKLENAAKRVAELHNEKRPVLLGTRTIETSDRLSEFLQGLGVEHVILNAHHEEKEAQIIAQAGKPGAVTVATNMAGRGTDIKPDQKVIKNGGLVVIVTERHDEERVDRQFFGRTGRQGDPGHVEVFTSLEDSLIRTHGYVPLVHLLKLHPGLSRWGGFRVLWHWSQSRASKKSRISRDSVSRQDAWIDRSLHHATR
jgi:preprotein translocase subunit SecA